uniref:Uncharacterized protein n=1 Tax=Oryza meridionalis TaxID=40149 RepID=A0A0E0DPW9_9ORYZ
MEESSTWELGVLLPTPKQCGAPVMEMEVSSVGGVIELPSGAGVGCRQCLREDLSVYTHGSGKINIFVCG